MHVCEGLQGSHLNETYFNMFPYTNLVIMSIVHPQLVVEAIYTIVYAKVRINRVAHGEVMSNIGVNQGCPLLTLFGLYNDKSETYLDEIIIDSLCLFDTMVTIILYFDDVVLLSKSGSSLQRLPNELFEFCTLSSLDVDLSKSLTQNHDLWPQQNEMKARGFCLSKDQIEITYEFKYYGIDLHSHGHFELSSKKQRIASMKALMGTLRKEAVIGVTSRELKSHRFKTLVLPTFTYGTTIWGGDFKHSHWKVFEKGMKIHMMSHVKVRFPTTYHILLAKFGVFPMELYALITTCPSTHLLVS